MMRKVKATREMIRLVERLGGEVTSIESGGRHGVNLVVSTPDGGSVKVPVATETISRHDRSRANSIAEVRRIIKGKGFR
jgi:hypothetical protein